MGLKSLPIAGNGNVGEIFIIAQRFKLRCDVGLKIVPPQAKLLVIGHFYTKKTVFVAISDAQRKSGQEVFSKGEHLRYKNKLPFNFNQYLCLILLANQEKEVSLIFGKRFSDQKQFRF